MRSSFIKNYDSEETDSNCIIEYYELDQGHLVISPTDVRFYVSKYAFKCDAKPIGRIVFDVPLKAQGHDGQHTIHREIGFNSGGGCLLDFIHLTNGMMICIGDDGCSLYSSHADFWIGNDGDWSHIKNIEFFN